MKIENGTVNTGCNIMIFTYDRPRYLQRILDYYDSFGENLKIVVGDSSCNKNKKINKKSISSILNLDIKYLDDYSTEIHQYQKCADMLNYAEEKYSVFCADDDFITPQGIKQSIDFLEKNPDFTVTQGRYFRFWSRSCRGNKQQFFCEYTTSLRPSVTFQDARKRLYYHMSNCSPTFYGVHRSAFLKMIFTETSEFISDGFPDNLGELSLSMLTSIYGKMKCLDMFYGAREAIPDSLGAKCKPLENYIKDGTFDKNYTKLRNCLSKHLNKSFQLTIEESRKAVDDAMSVYLSACIRNKEPAKNILIRKIRDILLDLRLPDWLYEGIRSLYRKLFLSKQKRMGDSKSFADTPFSKYYDEINNIYNHLVTYSKSHTKK